MLLELRGVSKAFASVVGAFSGKGTTVALGDVSFCVRRGGTLALVGESGSGKSTAARIALGLTRPDKGKVLFDGDDVFALKAKELKRFRRRAQMVFQNPGGSLNPSMTVGSIVAEGPKIHGLARGSRLKRLVRETLRKVALPGEDVLERYPHEFSGGQRQRIAIARALAVKPEFLVLDEPTSALDVSVQAGILNLLADLQAEMALTYLFISHDLAVVEHVAGYICVMQKGGIVEQGTREEVLGNPRHEYTKLLLKAATVAAPRP